MSKISIAGLAEETGLTKHAVRGRIVRDGLGPVGIDHDGRSNLYDRGAALCAVYGDERSENACAADRLAQVEKTLATVREAKAGALASLESASRTIQEREATIGRMTQQAARDQRKIELEYDARIAAEVELRDWRERSGGWEAKQRETSGELDGARKREAIAWSVSVALGLALAVVGTFAATVLL